MFDYKKIAASPVTSLSQLYYKLLDTTHIPDIQLTKEYKNELYLSIGEWKNKLPTIIVDAVNEECKTVLDTLSQWDITTHILSQRIIKKILDLKGVRFVHNISAKNLDYEKTFFKKLTYSRLRARPVLLLKTMAKVM